MDDYTEPHYRIARAYRQKRLSYGRAQSERRVIEDLPMPHQAYTAWEMADVLGLLQRVWRLRGSVPEDEPYAYEVERGLDGRLRRRIGSRPVYHDELVSQETARDMVLACRSADDEDDDD